MWWLCFERDGHLLGVAIIEAYSLVAARMRAALEGLDRNGDFTEGHALDARCCARLMPDYIGRLRSPREAAALLGRFDAAKKKPPSHQL